MIKTLKELIFFLKSDLYRYRGKLKWYLIIKDLIWDCRIKYTFWMRITNYLSNTKWSHILLKIPFFLSRIILQHYTHKCSMEIPYNTQIGPGLYINHTIGIIISKRAVIGSNCNISQNVTIGYISQGKRKGAPKIGDNVYIGAGAIIIGDITVGNNAAIGAGAVVVKDVS